MDGNNRWSKKNNLSKYNSYKTGAEKLIKISNFLFSNYNFKYISAFALSSNNLNRSKSTLNSIKKVLDKSLNEINKSKKNFDINFIGDIKFLDDLTRKKISSLNKKKENKKKLLIYLNYGGREDINQASIFLKNKKKTLKNFLLTKDYPDPEILIRTGGFCRLSNFLLYQLAFTELFFLKKLWPDLNNSDLDKIIKTYHNIERKFGR